MKTYWIARWKTSGQYHWETRATGPRLYPSLRMAKARVGGEKAAELFDFIEISLEPVDALTKHEMSDQ